MFRQWVSWKRGPHAYLRATQRLAHKYASPFRSAEPSPRSTPATRSRWADDEAARARPIAPQSAAGTATGLAPYLDVARRQTRGRRSAADSRARARTGARRGQVTRAREQEKEVQHPNEFEPPTARTAVMDTCRGTQSPGPFCFHSAAWGSRARRPQRRTRKTKAPGPT